MPASSQGESAVQRADGSDEKEVFAFFGLACFHAQVLEQELLLFASMLHLTRMTQLTSEDVNSLIDSLDTRTFGQLLTEARKLTTIPDALEIDLAEALRKRNDIAHRFFERHSEDFASSRGRAQMIEELQVSARLFADVDRAVTAIRGPLSARLGITDAMIQGELAKMEARAAARDASEA